MTYVHNQQSNEYRDGALCINTTHRVSGAQQKARGIKGHLDIKQPGRLVDEPWYHGKSPAAYHLQAAIPITPCMFPRIPAAIN